MSLDAAIYADRALEEAGCSASLQLIENASLLEQSQTPFRSLAQLHEIVPGNLSKHFQM